MIGRRLKQIRTEMGLSSTEFGKLIGKDNSTVTRYENDKIKNIPLLYIETIANKTGYNAAWIMGWDNNPIANMYRKAEEKYTGKVKQLAEIAMDLTDENIEILIGMANVFASNNKVHKEVTATGELLKKA